MLMICGRDHGRVLFQGVECPACHLVEEITELKNQIDHLSMELFNQDKLVNQD